MIESWRDAELLACAHMRDVGFGDAELTGAGADGGADVRAGGAIAQVKHYTDPPVGSPAVQRLRGAAFGTQWAIFYSLSGFSEQAQVAARATDVALFTYDLNGQVTPANEVACALLRSGGRMVTRDPRSPAGQRFVAALQVYVQEVLDAGGRAFGLVAEKLEARDGDVLAEVQVIAQNMQRMSELAVELDGKNEWILTRFVERVAELDSLQMDTLDRTGIDPLDVYGGLPDK